jgi:WD40 repeat protein
VLSSPLLLGVSQIWDTRTQSAIVTFSDHEDFISDFAVDKSGSTLLATSYDIACSCVSSLLVVTSAAFTWRL